MRLTTPIGAIPRPDQTGRRIILDTDSTALASRVSRSKADTTEIVINEQTVMNALQIMGERVRGQIARGL